MERIDAVLMTRTARRVVSEISSASPNAPQRSWFVEAAFEVPLHHLADVFVLRGEKLAVGKDASLVSVLRKK